MELPERWCEICCIIHKPPIHDVATCHPLRSGRVYFTPDSLTRWPTKDEMKAQTAYWDAVLADKGLKPLS